MVKNPVQINTTEDCIIIVVFVGWSGFREDFENAPVKKGAKKE